MGRTNALKLLWRTERDSNPRTAINRYTLSRRAPSTTRPSVHASQGAGIYRNWGAKQAGRLRTARFPAFAPKSLVVAGPAYAEIVLGGHHRECVPRNHVEEREHHEEEKGRGRKSLQRDELDQRDDEHDHREAVVDELLGTRAGGLDDFDEQHGKADQKQNIAEADVPRVAGKHRDRARRRQHALNIVIAGNVPTKRKQ